MDTSIQPASGVAVDALDGAVWHKSSYSGTQGNCVEVAINLPGVVAVRDSKDPNGPKLVISRDQWSAFVSGVRSVG
jgi:Domain of unknown function (DUF397)